MAKDDIRCGEMVSFSLKDARTRYRVSGPDAKRLRTALVRDGYLEERSGNRWMAAA